MICIGLPKPVGRGVNEGPPLIVFKVAELISYVSHFWSLQPGDVIIIPESTF